MGMGDLGLKWKGGEAETGARVWTKKKNLLSIYSTFICQHNICKPLFVSIWLRRHIRRTLSLSSHSHRHHNASQCATPPCMVSCCINIMNFRHTQQRDSLQLLLVPRKGNV